MEERHSIQTIQQKVIELISAELKIDKQSINQDSSFFDLGLDSINGIFLLSDLEDILQIDIDPMSIYDNPSIKSFSEYLLSELNGRN